MEAAVVISDECALDLKRVIGTNLGFFLCLSVSDDSDSSVVMRCIPF